MRRREEGSVAPQLMAVMILLAAMIAGLSAFLRSSFSYEKRSEVAEDRRSILESALVETLSIFSEDPSPEYDNPDEPIYQKVMSDNGLVEISVEEISSKLNPNFIRAELLTDTSLKSMLVSGVTTDSLRQFRAEKGLSTIDIHYKDLFTEESLPSLSNFGWANVNAVDPSSLGLLYASITGSESAAIAFQAQVEALWTNKKIIKPEDLDEFLGGDAVKLKSVMTAIPCYNVHFMDSAAIKAIVEWAPFKVEKASEKANILISKKPSGNLTSTDIATTLGVPADNRVLQYLGSRSWFWKIRASSDSGSLTAVIARDPRVPQESVDKKSAFLVIERIFER